MKPIKQLVSLLIAAALSMSLALGQTFPTTNPTFTPAAIKAPQTFTTTGDYTFTLAGVTTASIRVSGTCTSLASAPQVSNDGTNYTTVQAIPAVGGSLITSITGAGLWRINTSGMTQARLHITVLAASCTVAMAGTSANGTAYLMNPNSSTNPTYLTDSTGAYNWAVDSAGVGSVKLAVVDPCQNPGIQKLSAVVNVGAATTTKLVDVSASTVIYVCGFTASLAGTTPSVTFKSGTNVSADCDTGAATLSGVILPTSGSMVTLNAGGGTVLKTAAAKQLCATTAGSGSSLQGIVTYVQQ